jgi:hypothetical protein
MPTEIRHLMFRPAEVVQSIAQYLKRSGQSLPSGSIVSCGPESEGPGSAVRFRIVIALDVTEGTPEAGIEPRREVVIEGPALAAALILRCRDRRIPLPAQADKSLQRFGDQVCLIAALSPKQEEMPSFGQLVV